MWVLLLGTDCLSLARASCPFSSPVSVLALMLVESTVDLSGAVYKCSVTVTLHEYH